MLPFDVSEYDDMSSYDEVEVSSIQCYKQHGLNATNRLVITVHQEVCITPFMCNHL